MTKSFILTSILEVEMVVLAAEFVRDCEGDMSIDMCAELKHSNKRFDETLADIVEMRERVRSAAALVKSIKGRRGEFTLAPSDIPLIVRGLECMEDSLAEAISEPFFRKAFKNGVDAAGLVELRQAVEKAVARRETAAAMLAKFKS